MYKKFISGLLVIAIMNLFGCYSSELINVAEYKQIEEKEDKPNDIIVKTKDYQEYHFSDSNFYIENDTLYGRAILMLGAEGLPFNGKFAFSEIKTIQTENYGYMTFSIYQKIEAESGKPDEIWLTKIDSTRYHFMKNDYYTVNDTLFGKGKLLIDDREQLIPLSEIEAIQFEYVDGLKTAGLVLGIVGVLVIIIALAVSSISLGGLDLGEL